MEQTSKLISGFKKHSRKKLPFLKLSTEQKHKIVQDYLNSNETMGFIWEKHTGRKHGQFQITRWMQAFGYEGCSNFTQKTTHMTKKQNIDASDSFEVIQLKKRIAELENQLKDAEMKAIAFSTMVDIAEKEFNIPIRKKFNTKPSKK